MGRRPSRPDAIPRLRQRAQKSGKVFYYYDHGGSPRREEPLGSDFGLAIKRWAELHRAPMEKPQQVITFRYVADQYRAKIVPTKAPRTQVDNLAELAKLIEYFDDPPGPLEAIQPQDIRGYLNWRGTTAKTRANREKALLSHIWNFARDQGYTALPNPCAGIKGYRERGRDAYIDDDVYRAVWHRADQAVRDAMDLAYLTGQRPSDVLRMDESRMRENTIEVRQGKTGAKVRIEVVGELAAVIERIRARKRTYRVYSTRLVVNERGQPIGIEALQARFKTARKAAGVSAAEFQFRDLRAKAGTDKTESVGDIRQAQKQLGHANVTMTEHYVRNRRGSKVTPTK